jgi:hypothetical protein
LFLLVGKSEFSLLFSLSLMGVLLISWWLGILRGLRLWNMSASGYLIFIRSITVINTIQ